jgi:hypothetical protein
MPVEQYIGYCRKLQELRLVTSLQLTRNSFHKTHFIVICTVFISVTNLTLSVSTIGSHNLLCNVNRSRTCWKHFRKSVLWHAVLCIENRTYVKVRSRCLFLTEWWVTFEERNRTGVPHFNGLAIVSTVKGMKWRYFLLPSTKEATKRVSWNKHIVLILISHSSI